MILSESPELCVLLIPNELITTLPELFVTTFLFVTELFGVVADTTTQLPR